MTVQPGPQCGALCGCAFTVPGSVTQWPDELRHDLARPGTDGFSKDLVELGQGDRRVLAGHPADAQQVGKSGLLPTRQGPVRVIVTPG